MQKKQSILFVIDNLTKGGAEMLLVGMLDDLNKIFDVVLVTLSDECYFDEHSFDNITRYSLGVKSKSSYPKAISRLKKIIKNHNPVIVHSHLVYSTIISRLACPSNIPLVFSVHNEIGRNVFRVSPILSLLEKATIRKRHTLVAVSNAVLKDYMATVNFKGKTNVLENYIGDDFYSSNLKQNNFEPSEMLRMVALGNVKHSKNYKYLVNSFIALKGMPVQLDIYGKKDDIIYPELQVQIEKYNLPVTFKGIGGNIPELLSKYHLYVMSSIHEGFGIAAIEAMASNLPLLLSDLAVLREVTDGNAVFFDLNNPEGFTKRVKEILNEEHDLSQLSANGIEISKKYSKQNYLQKLMAIYNQVLHAL